MLRLNKKGFAISTILYGILSIVILLLMVIFALIRSSKRMNDNFTSDIEHKLNNCISDELVLEDCLISGNASCDRTAYYSCLGITDFNEDPSANFPKIKEKLLPTKTTSGDGLYSDDLENERFVYRGTNVNNYVRYDNRLWRIVAIEADSTVKIIYHDYDANRAWDTAGDISWPTSTINAYLNTTFYANLSDTNKLIKRAWNIGSIYDTGIMSLDEVLTQEKKDRYLGSVSTEGTVGLISTADYVKASTSTSCRTNVINNNGCKNWLSKNTATWTINSYVDPNNMSLRLGTTINNQGAITKDPTTSEKAIYPVVFLNKTVRISEGDGTLNNPYILN